MRGIRRRSSVKYVVAILCAACFLTMSIGNVSRAFAAEPWETWPKKSGEAGAEGANGATAAGEAAGTKTAMGLSYGTIGWIALGTAVIIGVAIAAGGGGGGGSTTPSHHTP
jgi:hypothetical protein